MSDYEYLIQKREEVMCELEKYCKPFGIKYDYLIAETGQTETLVLNGQKIGCSCNSISAIIDEVIGYLFIKRYCKNRYVGNFKTQTCNRVKEYWID